MDPWCHAHARGVVGCAQPLSKRARTGGPRLPGIRRRIEREARQRGQGPAPSKPRKMAGCLGSSSSEMRGFLSDGGESNEREAHAACNGEHECKLAMQKFAMAPCRAGLTAGA